MDISLVFGGFAMLFGVVTLIGRFVAPDSGMFSKLGPMKERFGDRAGTALHVTAYTVMPLLVGAVLLGRALSGASP
jgi:hypothetical protein